MGAEMLRMEVFGDEGLKFPGDTVIFPETDFLRIQDMLSTMSIPAVWTGKSIILLLSIHKGLFTLNESNAKFDLSGLSGNSIYYRPQMKFAKVMFLHVSVILSTGREVSRPRPPNIPPGSGSRHPPCEQNS